MPQDTLQLYPPPKRLRSLKSGFKRGERRLIRILGGCSPRVHSVLSNFASCHDLVLTHGEPSPNQVFMSVTFARGLADEGYTLRASGSGMTLKASSDSGVFYGLQTLTQILDQWGHNLPGFSIEDSPDFPHRGVMLDISRCKVPTLQTLLELVDQFAALKFNQLQLYTEHTFAFVNHPLVWANASPLSPADIIALKDYCASRFIELV
ncbi:MAG: glycoside hydrolase family 20 zincin-like fold domain-containing protein, partial [Pseudomonadales bacterium]